MNITLRDLLDAGLHFGHQLRRYNPKSKKYVFDNRHGISIIDLEIAYGKLEEATQFVEELAKTSQKILFVGTKRQAKEIIREAATQCQMPYCASRWLGGTLTNFATIKNSMAKYRKYLAMQADGSLDKTHKKEAAAIRRDMNRMHRNFEGIIDMTDLPAAMFVIDTKHEQIAVAEANRLEIPVIGLVDTNSDPTIINYPIPGNDDSSKSIRLIVEVIMEAVQDGVARRQAPQAGQGLTPMLRDEAKEEQLPVTPMAPMATMADAPVVSEIPESYSTDQD